MVELDYSKEDSEKYGTQGQEQQGIEIYARKPNGKYNVYQCKKYKSLTKSIFTKAVKEFRKGKWYELADEFVFCTSASMNDVKLQDEFETQKNILAADGIKLIKWDVNTISRLLKSKKNIVNEYFGEDWVNVFNNPSKYNQFESLVKTKYLPVKNYIPRSLAHISQIEFNKIPHQSWALGSSEGGDCLVDLVKSKNTLCC